MQTFKKITLALFIFTWAGFLSQASLNIVLAQNNSENGTGETAADLNLTVFPQAAYLLVKPGTEIEHKILVDYQGSIPIYLTPQLVEFTTDGQTGRPILGETTKLDFINLRNPGWELNQPTRLKPGTQIQLVLDLKPSVRTKLVEHPLSLILMAQPTIDIIRDGSRAQTSGAVASNIILSVQSDYQNLGELIINQLKLPRFVDSFQNLKFTLNAYNEGRNAVAAQGEVTLTHLWSGKTVKHWFIYPDVVLADNSRDLRGILTDPAELNPDQAFELEEFAYKPAFLLGPYELTVKLSDSSQVGTNQATEPTNNESTNNANTDQRDLVHQETRQVFAFPFSILGALLLGVIILFVYYWFEQRSTSPKKTKGF